MLARCLGLVFALAVPAGFALTLPDAKPCDVASVAPAAYCDKCAKFFETSDIDAEKKTHKGTDHATRTVDACSKTNVNCTVCKMGWAEASSPPPMCKDHKTTKEVVKARVGVRCGACKAWAEKAADLKHASADCKGTATRSCEKSGTSPHITPA